MDFNQRITKVIEFSNFSPAEFAEEIGVQRSSISHILSGRNKPSLDFITKIKSRFPDLSWDWLINGYGEMIPENSIEIETQPILETEKQEVKKTTSLPDLFSIINDDSFGIDKSEETIQNQIKRESDKTEIRIDETKISNSQPLENIITKQEKKKNIKQIVVFFTDGSFENYEN